MKSKSLVLMILSLGFGLVAAIGISQVMGGKNNADAPAIPKKTVLVAIKDLEHHAFLNEELVKVEEWPLEIIPENTASSLDQIKDQATLQSLSKGMPIILSNLKHIKLIDDIQIPEGYTVFYVKFSSEDTGHGLLQPGHKVNMIGHIPGKPTKTFLRGLRIHSVNAQTTAQKKEDGGSGSDAVVGILVSERQSELIYQVQKGGTVKIVMRGDHVTDRDSGNGGLDDEGIAALGLDGKAAIEPTNQATDTQPESTPQPTAQTSKTMKIWTREGVEEVAFRDGLVVSPGPIDRYRPASSSKPEDVDSESEDSFRNSKSGRFDSGSDDSEDFDDSKGSDTSDDRKRGLEEDQY